MRPLARRILNPGKMRAWEEQAATVEESDPRGSFAAAYRIADTSKVQAAAGAYEGAFDDAEADRLADEALVAAHRAEDAERRCLAGAASAIGGSDRLRANALSVRWRRNRKHTERLAGNWSCASLPRQSVSVNGSSGGTLRRVAPGMARKANAGA